MSDSTVASSMTAEESPKFASLNQIRLWPAVPILALPWLARFWANSGDPAPSKFFFGLVIIPQIAALLLILWWLFASRLRWADRLGIFLLAIVTTLVTRAVSGKNFPDIALIFYVVPILITVWTGWLLLSYRFPWAVRRAVLALAIIGCGTVTSMLRVEGVDGSFAPKFSWRWTPTAESRMLTELKSQSNQSVPVIDIVQDGSTAPQLTPPADGSLIALQEGDWPGFRGPHRDGRLVGVHIESSWDKTPPRELWRHRIGPGWSSCCIVNGRLYTQEQRGEDEFVVCYDALTGREIWTHRDATRFEEVVAGPGPRGTPTFDQGRIYALGANGNLNCLDAMTGKIVWQANIVKDCDVKKVPQWGYSGSPLVFHHRVSVFAGGENGKSVAAYDVETGKLAWTAGEGKSSYCSTQATTFDGIEQVLIATEAGLFAFEPDNGAVLWQYNWPVEVARVVQPAIFKETEILLGTGMAHGTRRLSLQHAGDQWAVKELWTTKAIKPYYNDLVISGDYLYGFDGPIFMCVSLEDGKMKWRARGYGNGQVLLLTDDKLLLILSEQGEVALVEARPDQHAERARFKAIEGKTWNHPVVAHGKLYVRNAEEIACFELAPAAQVAGSPR